MPYSIELRFDDALCARISEVRRALAERDICPLPPAAAAPHVSLAVYDDEHGIDPSPLAAMTDRFASDHAPLPLVFSSAGVFLGEERVLFLAPVPSRGLLDLHAAWHALAAENAASCWSYYRPGSWAPHCTLCTALPASDLARAIAHLGEHWTPLGGTLCTLALIRAQPVEVLEERPLSGRAA